jgi:iron-sulfur cluster repair protein YtfE (RIC family)
MLTHQTRSSLAVGAVLGLGAGLFANLARKAMVQAPTMLAADWADALALEHRAALKLFDALEQTTAEDAGKRTTLLTQLKHAIGKHAFQEENVVYPALRDHGLAPAEEELAREHGDVKHFLFQLSEMERSHPDWLATVRSLRAAIEPHMAEEEQTIFPQLRDKLGEEGNRALAQAMNREGLKLA